MLAGSDLLSTAEFWRVVQRRPRTYLLRVKANCAGFGEADHPRRQGVRDGVGSTLPIGQMMKQPVAGASPARMRWLRLFRSILHASTSRNSLTAADRLRFTSVRLLRVRGRSKPVRQRTTAVRSSYGSAPPASDHGHRMSAAVGRNTRSGVATVLDGSDPRPSDQRRRGPRLWYSTVRNRKFSVVRGSDHPAARRPGSTPSDVVLERLEHRTDALRAADVRHRVHASHPAGASVVDCRWRCSVLDPQPADDLRAGPVVNQHAASR